MRMNGTETALVNSPPRRLLQRYEAGRLIAMGGRTPGARVAELGCGSGYGTKLILDVFGAAQVDAVDLDPAMLTPVVLDVGEALVLKQAFDSDELPSEETLAAIVDQAILPAVGKPPPRR